MNQSQNSDDEGLTPRQMRKLRFEAAEARRKEKYAAKMAEHALKMDAIQAKSKAADLKFAEQSAQRKATFAANMARINAELAASKNTHSDKKMSDSEEIQAVASDRKVTSDFMTLGDSSVTYEVENVARDFSTNASDTATKDKKPGSNLAPSKRVASSNTKGRKSTSKGSEVDGAIAKKQKPEVARATKLKTPTYVRPDACIRCKQADQLKKWTSIVASQTNTSTSSGKAVTNRGLFRNDWVTTIETTTSASSALAKRYPKPEEQSSNIYVAYIIGIGGSLLGIFIQIILSVAVPILILAIIRSNSLAHKINVQRLKQNYYDALAKFDSSWYCARCDQIFCIEKEPKP